MTEKELLRLKEAYFRVNILRTGIPAKYYELPPEVIRQYEEGQQEARQREKLQRERGIVPPERVQEYPGQLCPKMARRPVGDFSILEVDSFPDWD